MKTLLTLAFCLLAVMANAANPSTKSFRATGGLTVASNDITGVIIYDGSGISSPTGGVSATSATNIAKTAVTVAAGTNIVVTTNSTAANTTYTVSTATDVFVPGQFTVGGVSDLQDDVFIGGIADFNAAATFNAAVIIPAGAVNGYVFTANGAGSGTWQPSATGSTTNLGVGQTIFLDASFGNDATAQRTNMARPYLTASNAVDAILSGYTLRVRGGTYLVNPKSSFEVGSAGLSISNKSNFRITGEPGAVWKMSGMYASNGISGGSMLLLVNCTNFVIDNMTFVGFATNGIITNRTEQGFGIALQSCGHYTIENCTLDDWHDHGIANMGEFTDNSYVTIRNSLFSDIGSTNHVTLGADGTAINVLASNMTVTGNSFLRNIRDFEYHGSAVAKNILFAGNRSEKARDCPIIFATPANSFSDVQILDNSFIGYATNTVSATTRATWLNVYSVSNMIVSGNYAAGYVAGITYGFDTTIADSVCVDVTIHNNVIYDITDFGIYMLRDRGTVATLARVSIMQNKFQQVGYCGVTVNGNNSRVEENEFVNCAYLADPSGVIMIGRNSAAFTTNSTNITIVGNKIYNTSLAANAAPGIHIVAGSWSNIVWGNENKSYAAMVNSGSNTLTQPINLLAPGAILGVNNSGRMALVIIGSGVALDTNTMTLTGTGGAGGSAITSINEFTNSEVVFAILSNAYSATVQIPFLNAYAGGVDWHLPWAGPATGGPLHSNDWVRFNAGGSVGPGALGFNLNQFNTNGIVSIKSGALSTNLVLLGTVGFGAANEMVLFYDDATDELIFQDGRFSPTNMFGISNGVPEFYISPRLETIPASSLLRTDSARRISVVTVGANLTFDGTTLAATGGSGSGETNYNQDASLTNATRLGLVFGKTDVTNKLRTIQSGNGIVLTNLGTNIPIAIDPAVVASQANLTAASNAIVAMGGGAAPGKSNQIPFLNSAGTGYMYAGYLSQTNPGFGFSPSGPHGGAVGYGGLMVFADNPMALLTVGHPNPASDFAGYVTAIVASNRYNGTGFKQELVKFDGVDVGDGSDPTSTLTTWRNWVSGVPTIVAEIRKDGQMTLAGGLSTGTGGQGSASFSTNFTLQGIATITPSVRRTPTNANSGVLVALPVAGITNQEVAVPLTAGQTLTYNGTNYVPGPLSVAITDTNNPTFTVDFALGWSSYTVTGGGATNITIGLTNTWAAFPGRSISVEFQTNMVSYSLNVTNVAAQAIRYSPSVLTNGYPTFVKTNTSHFSLVFTMPTTNYPIADAAFYR